MQKNLNIYFNNIIDLKLSSLIIVLKYLNKILVI